MVDALTWIEVTALGGLMGGLGQGARVVVGIKKQHDTSSQQGRTVAQDFDAGQLTISLLIGFIAGAVAAVPLHDVVAAATPEVLGGLMAAGYAGTDFIEGFMRRELPGSIASAASAVAGSAPIANVASPQPA